MLAACRTAAKTGLEIGFSDHYDLVPADPCTNYFQADAFWAELTACRETYGDRLAIRAGIEVGEAHLYANEVEEMLASHPWDYVLGSLHWVGEESVFDPEYFRRRSEDEAYCAYFRALLDLVRDGEFDVLAHMDVVKRLGFSWHRSYEPQRYEEDIRAVLATLAGRGLGLEINTKTLRTDVRDFSPSPLIVQWFHEEGGKWITLGSDSHQTSTIGAGVHEAARLAERSGFKGIASFQRRTPSLVGF